MIYVASPYTHSNEVVMHQRYNGAVLYTGRLIASGVPCFSPIAYGRQFHACGFAAPDFQFWQEMNEQFISMADEMHVLMLPGWEDSKGIAAEIAFAAAYNIPVSFIAP